MTLPYLVLTFLVGFLAGPVIHELAVSTGAGEPRRWRPRCGGCGLPLPFRRWWSGRCSRCGTPVRRRVAFVSVLSGAVFAIVPAFAELPVFALPAYGWFLSATVVFVISDLDHRRIPNRITYPTIVGGAGLLGLTELVAPSSGSAVRGLVASAAAFGVFLLLGILARGGLGMGDVKLMALVGLFLGYRGWDVLFLGVLFGALAGGIPAIVLLLTRRAGRKDELAYGPPLILGAWVALAAGERFLTWYLG